MIIYDIIRSIPESMSSTRAVESFFNTWTPEMAYILGYFAADGTIYKNSRNSSYIAFTSIDKDQIEMVKKLLNVTNSIEAYQPKGNTKLRYTIQIGSYKIYTELINLGFTPNKSLSLKMPNVPDELFNHFIRGYFDGDGTFYSGFTKRKDRKGEIRHLQINFRSGSKSFLHKLHTTLLALKITQGGSLYFHARAYSLAYSGKDVVNLYRFLYSDVSVPCLMRKKVAMEEGISSWGRISMVR